MALLKECAVSSAPGYKHRTPMGWPDKDILALQGETMKRAIKSKPKRGAARDLFEELSDGLEALADARQGKRTLRTHTTEFKPGVEVGEMVINCLYAE